MNNWKTYLPDIAIEKYHNNELMMSILETYSYSVKINGYKNASMILLHEIEINNWLIESQRKHIASLEAKLGE